MPTSVQMIRVPLGVNGRRTGTLDVPITDVQGGLALQRALDGPGWHVVHVGSGRLVTPPRRRKAEARALQRALLALAGIDWTWSLTRLRRLPAAQRAVVVGVIVAHAPEKEP